MKDMKLRRNIDDLKNYFSYEIWNENLAELSKFRAKMVHNIQILLLTFKTFSAEKIGFQAVALSFFCTMSVIPFMAVAFAITGGFGLEDVLKQVLYENFDNQEIIDNVCAFAENIINTAQSNVVGLISASIFVWLILWMMFCVERVFNNAWRVRKSRKFYKRFSFYIAILVLSPFVILLFFTGSIVYSNILDLIVPNVEFSESIKSFLSWFIFGVISVMVLSAMYKFIPNAKVKYLHAFKAALVAGIAFTLMQYLYLETQIFVTRLNAVYGAIAAIPLFMFWLNFGWFIILFGAELSYAFQNVNDYNLEIDKR